jgi:hypothetical protein
MAALAFQIAFGMSNKGLASFCPHRTPPHHTRVDLSSPSGVANPEALSREAKQSCARRHDFPSCNCHHCHPPTNLAPKSLPARHLPFRNRRCCQFPPPPLSPHLMLIVRSSPSNTSEPLSFSFSPPCQCHPRT